MLPTTQQVNDYLTTQTEPVSSKNIAKHFQCTSKDINRNRDTYIGIYSNPDVSSVDYLHSIKVHTVQVQEPEPIPYEPEPQLAIMPPPEPMPQLAIMPPPKPKMKVTLKKSKPKPEPEPVICPICLENLRPAEGWSYAKEPISWGCCSAMMCAPCTFKLMARGPQNAFLARTYKCPVCRAPYDGSLGLGSSGFDIIEGSTARYKLASGTHTAYYKNGVWKHAHRGVERQCNNYKDITNIIDPI